MPIWLRRYTFNALNEFYQKEQEEYDKVSGKGELITEKSVNFKDSISKTVADKATYTSKVARPDIPNSAIKKAVNKAIYNGKK